jgi:hypothetical protein
MILPLPTSELIERPLTIDECLNLMEKETAVFERQLKKRQLRIIMRLAQDASHSESDKSTRKIVNSAIDIVNTRLRGLESISNDWLYISHQLYFELLKEITSDLT